MPQYNKTMIELLKNLYSNPLIGGALMISIVGILIASLKELPKTIFERIKRNIFYSIHLDETDELFVYFERWLKFHHEKQYRNVTASLIEDSNFSDLKNNDVKKDIVYYNQHSDFILIKYKNKWLTINKIRQKLENASSKKNIFFNSFTISVFLNKKILITLMDDVINFNQQFKPDNCVVPIWSTDQWGNWWKIRNLHPKTFDNIFIDVTLKEELLQDANNFVANKQWYNDRSIPYKRGYCFYGEPGNGKTSLALSLAQHLNRPVNILSLQGMNDQSLRFAFRELKNNSILLIEDIDAIFEKRESKVKDLTFSTLLQCLDGVFYSDNTILIITTNHIEQLDCALLRDGRIDVKLNIHNPTLSVIVDYINTFYKTKIDFKLNGNANHIVGLSMSKIQNICIKNPDPQNAFNEITKKLQKKLIKH